MAFTERGVSLRIKDQGTAKSTTFEFTTEQMRLFEEQDFTPELRALAYRTFNYVRALDVSTDYTTPILMLLVQGSISFNERGELPWISFSPNEEDFW